jgi:hypothetical protein
MTSAAPKQVRQVKSAKISIVALILKHKKLNTLICATQRRLAGHPKLKRPYLPHRYQPRYAKNGYFHVFELGM